MRRFAARLAGLALVTALAAIVSTAGAAPPDGSQPVSRQPAADDVPNPVEEKRRELRKAALQKVINGERRCSAATAARSPRSARRAGRATAPAVDQYVELAREKTDKIFVVLAEFGDQRDPRYPDQDTDPATPGPTRFDGPLHNQIPEPDRTKDNSTVWQPDYSPDHYRSSTSAQGAGVESLKTYYERQSSGRYSVDGQVTDWVKVPFNEARYGRSDGFPCAGQRLREHLGPRPGRARPRGSPTSTRRAAPTRRSQADLAVLRPVGPQRLRRRRQLQRARRLHRPLPDRPRRRRPGRRRPVPGRGRDLVAPLEGVPRPGRPSGPPATRTAATQIGNTGLWVADYTIQPENGGLSASSRTSTATTSACPTSTTPPAAGDNAVEWWTLMAQSRASAPQDAGHRRRARPTSAPGTSSSSAGSTTRSSSPASSRTLDLGPHEYNSAKAQGAVVVLPKKDGHDRLRRAVRRRASSGGRGPATTSTTRCRAR